MEILSTVLFTLAVVHTFCAKSLEHLAHIDPGNYDFAQKKAKPVNGNGEPGFLDRFLARHERLTRFIHQHHGPFDFFGEVEAVFPLWAAALALCTLSVAGKHGLIEKMESISFIEPIFVGTIMMVAASKPVKLFAEKLIFLAVKLMPFSGMNALLLVVLTLGTLLGSLITEPAAITICALTIGKFIFEFARGKRYHKFRYSVLACLLVNISIGGTLTTFAAPPVVMVAHVWHWDMAFMFSNFGWKAIIACIINAGLVVIFNREAIKELNLHYRTPSNTEVMPGWVTAYHLGCLAWIVWFSHHPAVFVFGFGAYLFIAMSYKQYQDEKLFFRPSFMVGLFLAGLVVLGSGQSWWLQPLLTVLGPYSLFFGALGLTAITDNAALTYLGSLVKGLSDQSKRLLVAGAVAGGGTTIIANAPNPAGIGILKEYFGDEAVSAKSLFIASMRPTAIAAAAFLLLP